MTFEEARNLPLPELTPRILDQLGATVIAVERPREGQRREFRLATRAIPRYPDICETQFIDLRFDGATGPDGVPIIDRTDRLSMSLGITFGSIVIEDVAAGGRLLVGADEVIP